MTKAEKAVATRALLAAHLPICPTGQCRRTNIAAGDPRDAAGAALFNNLRNDRRDALGQNEPAAPSAPSIARSLSLEKPPMPEITPVPAPTMTAVNWLSAVVAVLGAGASAANVAYPTAPWWATIICIFVTGGAAAVAARKR